MLALVHDGELHLDPHHTLPEGTGEALIRVRMAGICATDLEILRGYKGFTGILGHEFVGEIIRGTDSRLVGSRVCGEINVWCNTCTECAAGHTTHCLHRSVLGILGRNGAFAQYLTLPERNLHVVPDKLRDEEAVFTEPLAAAFEIVEQVTIEPNWRVAVLGGGKLGTLCSQVLRAVGAEPTILARYPRQLELLSRLKLHAREENTHDLAAWDMVVEATGSARGIESAIRLLRPRGTLVLKTTAAHPDAVDLSGIVVKELTVIGSRCGPFAPAMRALAEGVIQVDPLIERIFPLSDGMAALAHAAHPGSLKVLLDMRT